MITNRNEAKAGKVIRRLNERYRQGLPLRVLFVCLGNICRSPAAEEVMRHQMAQVKGASDWVIDSAGTGNYHVGDLPDPRMRVKASRRGYELNHRCRQVKVSDFDDFDVIFGMDDSNVSNLLRLAPTVEAQDKVLPMSAFFGPDAPTDYVPDPYYGGEQGFDNVLDILESAISRFLEQATCAGNGSDKL